ncbi:MAG TPA: alkaline phosphatase family protein [Solirubrobacterales bacterium]|nr:alkaline phosphatase family protein [Solirubrobacterales bacterium]
MNALTRPFHRAIAAAATLTGKRFSLLVASSLVATSAIVASAMTNPADNGPLAALLGRSLASDNSPAATSPAAGPSQSPPAGPAGRSAQPAGNSATTAGGPLASPAPSSAPAASRPASHPATPSTPTVPSTPTPEAGRIKHVFVISLASPGYEAAFGAAPQMPYLATTLRPQSELLSGYSLLGSTGLPNEIAAIGGQPPNPSTQANCSTYAEFPLNTAPNRKGVVAGSGCVYPVETLTLADQLTSARLHWRAYMDGMVDETGAPHNCVHPNSGAADQPAPGVYAARQNPFVYFHSLLDLGDCAINDVPLTELGNDLSKIASTPNFSFIAPNLCDAGVAGQCPAGAPEGAASADAFLSQWVPKILASPAYKQDGLLIVTFDEANPPDPTATATPTPTPPQVGALLLSRYVTRGSTDATPYDPYSLLRSTEDLFGLSHLAMANGAKVKSFAPALLGEDGGD